MAFPATPQKPLPGAFLTTPAPSRLTKPVSFQSFHHGTLQLETGSMNAIDTARDLAKPQALRPVQRAARTINDILQREACFPDLDSYVRR